MQYTVSDLRNEHNWRMEIVLPVQYAPDGRPIIAKFYFSASDRVLPDGTVVAHGVPPASF